MKIKLIRHINQDKQNRIEVLFQGFPYIDGNELIAKYMEENLNVKMTERVDELYYSVMRLQRENIEYILVWHEDVGNYGYCVPSTEDNLSQFEDDLTKTFEAIYSSKQNG